MKYILMLILLQSIFCPIFISAIDTSTENLEIKDSVKMEIIKIQNLKSNIIINLELTNNLNDTIAVYKPSYRSLNDDTFFINIISKKNGLKYDYCPYKIIYCVELEYIDLNTSTSILIPPKSKIITKYNLSKKHISYGGLKKFESYLISIKFNSVLAAMLGSL